MVKLIDSTRPTSHMGSLATIRVRSPRLGEEAGLNQLLRYRVQGLEMKMALVTYDDGATLGWFHAAVEADDKFVTLTHLGGSNSAYDMAFEKKWSMCFERI